MNRNRTQKFKSWMKDHQDAIKLGAIATSVTALYVGAVYLATKVDQANEKEAQRVRDWTIEQNAKGRSIFQLADGSLLSVNSADLLK